MKRRSTIPLLIALIVSILVAAACGGGPTVPASDELQVTGVITRIVPIPDGVFPAITVEEKPGRWRKMTFAISHETEILIRLGGGDFARVDVADLSVGRTVRAWKGPTVADSALRSLVLVGRLRPATTSRIVS